MRKTSMCMMAALLAGSLFASEAAVAEGQGKPSPGVVLQGPGEYRFKVGEVLVAALSDGTVPGDLHKLLLGTTATKTDALLALGYLSNPVEVSINAYIFAMNGRLFLVDTGAGDLFGPGFGGRLVDNLVALGVQPGQVTDILVTHVHTDHTGGLLKDGKLAFPNATIHVGKPDVDFFLDRANSARTGYPINYFDEAIKTLKPYVDAGKVRAFSQSVEIVPGLMATLHPGHTPGSAFYTLKSGGKQIMFVGDIIHVAAVQMPDPSITIVYDVDPKEAAEVRIEQFRDIARNGSLIAAPHLPFSRSGACAPGARCVRVGAC